MIGAINSSSFRAIYYKKFARKAPRKIKNKIKSD